MTMKIVRHLQPAMLKLRLWLWCGNLLFTTAVTPTADEKTLYLNSYAHCGADNRDDTGLPYRNLDPNTVFNILDETSEDVTTRAWRECDIVLRSARSDGRLCVLQRQLKFEDCHVRLQLYDGWAGVDGVTTANKTADCGKGLQSVEWCTSGRYLTIGTKKIGKKPDVRHMNIDLLVYDMRSPHRRAYMDSLPYCGSTYQLDSSQVTISNRDPYREVKDIFPQCTLTFKYVGHDPNKTLCVVFMSSSERNPECKMNYTLKLSEIVFDESTEVKESQLQHTYSCQNPSPIRWCASSNQIDLDLQREGFSSDQKERERHGVFTAVVLDYKGPVDAIPLPVTQQTPENSTSPTLSAPAITLVIVGIVIAITSIVAVVVFIRWQCRRAPKHSLVPGSNDMPPKYSRNGSANGHCADESDALRVML